MIKIKELQVNKNNNLILDIEKLDLKNDKAIGVWGANGAGKSTLIKCILGLEHYKGHIEFYNGKSNIQVIMQDNRYPEYAKVKDIILLILNIKTLDSVMEFIRYIDFEKCLNKEISVLSAGEYQKLNLILVLNLNPSLLIVDEVTTGLDYLTRKKIIEYIKKYLDEHDCCFIIISHYKEELEKLTSKTIILDKGKIIALCNSNKIEEYLKHTEMEECLGGDIDEATK